MADTTDTTPVVFFNKNTKYAVSINPEDKYQHNGDSNRYGKCHQLFYELFLDLPTKHIDYEFNIELSEPKNNKFGSGPRYHVHGWIEMKSDHSVFQFLDNVYYKFTRLGHVDIDTIDDLPKWLQYMRKQQHVFKHLRPVFTNLTEDSLKKGKVIRKTVGLSKAEEDREP